MSARFFRACCCLAAIILHPAANLDIPDLNMEVPAGKGLIIVANHRSMMDILVGLAIFRRWCLMPRLLVKASFFEIAGVGLLLHSLRAIPASRERVRSMMQTSLDTLAQGGVIALAAEGRVTPPSDRVSGIGDLRPGVGRLAVEFGTPIAVLGITNTDQVWPLGSRFPKVKIHRSSRPTIAVRVSLLEVVQGTPTAVVMKELKDIMLETIARAETRD